MDNNSVVDFYNKLDALLELSIEVLDDFCGEAVEVQECNPWLISRSQEKAVSMFLYRCLKMC